MTSSYTIPITPEKSGFARLKPTIINVMRREWGAWIKGRDWQEFERLAKVDPSQPLADTMAELAKGFPDKADRKALKKILFLLGQQGYHPREVEEESDAPAAIKPPVLLDFAFMTTPEMAGRQEVIYLRQSGDQYLILTGAIRTGGGFMRMEEQAVSTEVGLAYAETCRTMSASDGVFVKVPPDFALGRLAQTLQLTPTPHPSVIAYWRVKIEKAPPLIHPGEALARREADPVARQEAMDDQPVSWWSLDATPIISEAAELFQKRKELNWTPDEFLEQILLMLTMRRSALISAATIQDYRTRLLDCAYLISLRGDAGGEVLLWIADDLANRGADSEIAEVLLRRLSKRIQGVGDRPLMQRLGPEEEITVVT